MASVAAAFHQTPRPAIVRIVALPMSEGQLLSKTFDYYSSDVPSELSNSEKRILHLPLYHHDDDGNHRNAISMAPSFDEYAKQRAGDGL